MAILRVAKGFGDDKPAFIVVPDHDKVSVQDDGRDLRITIRITQPLPVMMWLGTMLALWVSAGIAGIIALWNGAPRPGDHFGLLWIPVEAAKGADFIQLMLYWLAGWTVVCALLVVVFLWNLMGKEIIELNSTTLRHSRRIAILSRSKEYAVEKISVLRLIPYPWNQARRFSFLGFRSAPIAFTYGRYTRRLGEGLDEANAHYVIQKMRDRVKSLGANAG